MAIVVPLSTRRHLLPEEEVSLRHLRHYLAPYDKYAVAPAGAPVRLEGFRTVHFPRRFFGSAAAINLLNFSPCLYETFADYEYILTYHLDSLVFSDQLLRWCATGVDYIGAPWIPCEDTPWVQEPRVGNGGFTLLKVASALQVLATRARQRPTTYWAEFVLRHSHLFEPMIAAAAGARRTGLRSPSLDRLLERWAVAQDPAAHGWNNDFLWSYEAVEHVPTFTVATVEQGLSFAFEASPRTCFELNHRRLPFGCHAWARYDRAFWEPYLLPAA